MGLSQRPVCALHGEGVLPAHSAFGDAEMKGSLVMPLAGAESRRQEGTEQRAVLLGDMADDPSQNSQSPGCRLLLCLPSWEEAHMNPWLGRGASSSCSWGPQLSSLGQVSGEQWEATRGHMQTGLGSLNLLPGGPQSLGPWRCSLGGRQWPKDGDSFPKGH